MTATPHNGKEEDFQLFLKLIDEDRFEGKFREGTHKIDISDIMRRMNKEDEVMQHIIKEGISKFIDHQILQFKVELKSVPLYFVGSIAFYAQDFIVEALKKRGLRASRFIKRPIENLISKIKQETF